MADTYTAVNLLAFDKWSSKIEPAIPLKYSKWIFAGCIIASWVLCGFEWVRAIRVIRRGGVAESYMDTLAVSIQSMRGKGWKRFLVFAELTKSKKGVDYIALFVYFQFQGKSDCTQISFRPVTDDSYRRDSCHFGWRASSSRQRAYAVLSHAG